MQSIDKILIGAAALSMGVLALVFSPSSDASPASDDVIAFSTEDPVPAAIVPAPTTTTTQAPTTTTTTEPPRASVACPAPGSEFIDSWGFRRSGGRSHKGVDMMAPHGSPVLAPVDGVVRSHTSRLGGLSFYLDGDDGNEYFGAHLQTMTGEGWVAAGTPIGTVGSTGNASRSGPHLHFEVHPDHGPAVNPYPFVAFLCHGDPADLEPDPLDFEVRRKFF